MTKETTNAALLAAKESLRQQTGNDYEITLIIFGPAEPGVLEIASTFKTKTFIAAILHKAYCEISEITYRGPSPPPRKVPAGWVKRIMNNISKYRGNHKQ